MTYKLFDPIRYIAEAALWLHELHSRDDNTPRYQKVARKAHAIVWHDRALIPSQMEAHSARLDVYLKKSREPFETKTKPGN